MASRHRFWAWVVGLPALAILIALGLWFRVRSHPIATPSKVPNGASMELPALIKPSAAKLQRPAPKSVPNNVIKVEICGFGKVPLDAADPSAVDDYLRARIEKSSGNWLTALLNSDDYRARAAGLFLEGKINGGPSVQAMTEQTRDALVQLAVGAGDPAVYAMAVYACNGIGDSSEGTCRQISADEWARMDSDNAAPWLMLAANAREKHDVAAEVRAFAQAAKTSRSDSYAYSLYAFAESELPKDVTPVERWYLAVQVMGIEGAIKQDQYLLASKHCAVNAMQDSSVRQQCSALAELWVTRGTNMLDFGMGTAIGARAGWPPQRVNRLKMERDALMQLINEDAPTSIDDFWGCGGVLRRNAHVKQISRMGEVGAARDTLERSGETVPELAQKWAKYLEKISHEAELRLQAAPVEPEP